MAAFMDSCAMTIPTRSALLCSPFDISLTDIWAIATACLLVPSNAAIWVIATAYLFPTILGTYFSRGFLTLVLRAAIPWRGGAGLQGQAWLVVPEFPHSVVRVHH
jgi:hypothetical protein